MMGSLPPDQNNLFYDFNLEKHIPADHLLRRINGFLDFSGIRQHLEPYYSHTGRPSIDPELMIRMLLIGYCYGIRSERRLCEEVNFNLAYRWFCGLGLEDEVPNHSTFSKNRHGRFRCSDLLREVFNTIVEVCIEQNLVKGEGFAIDASLVRADVSRWERTDQPADIDWSLRATESHAVRDYLDALDDRPELNRKRKAISMTDPMAQWSAVGKGAAEFYYSTNYLIDVDNNIVMDVEWSPSVRNLEVDTTRTMIDRVEDNHGILPERLMGDTAYGVARNLGYLVEEKQIEPHIPVWDKSHRDDGTMENKEFIWNAESAVYICPQGKLLKHGRGKFRNNKQGVTDENTRIYRATPSDCKDCLLKPRCCPNTTHRKIARSIHEEARDKAKEILNSPAYVKSFKERKKVEMCFAHMKRHLNFNRLRLRGHRGVNDEFLMVASAYNLKKLASMRAPPAYATG